MPKRARSVYVREGLLLLGFVLLLVASAVSVLVPELAREPEVDAAPAGAQGQAAAAAP